MKTSNQNRLEKIRLELFEIANAYAITGNGYIAMTLRGMSNTLHGILNCLIQNGGVICKKEDN